MTYRAESNFYGVNVNQGHFLLFSERSLEDKNLLYEIQLQDFLRWWQIEENRRRFYNLSFRIKNQVDLFFSTLEKSGFSDAFSQLKMDLYGYYLEYIKQEALLPFTLRFNERGKLIGDFYGDRPMTEITDPNERDGVVTQAMIDLEEKIKNLEDNQLIFRISPSGWTGFSYRYTESQAQIYWREGDKVRGLTVRLEDDLGKIIYFLQKLGIVFPSDLDEKELIKAITGLNLFINETHVSFLYDLANHFRKDHRGRSLRGSISIWQNTESDFRYYDELVDLISFLKQQLESGKIKSKEELEMVLCFVLMVMSGQELQKKEKTSQFVLNSFSVNKASYYLYSNSRYIPLNFYDKVFDHLRSLPGCAGGGIFGRREGFWSVFEGENSISNPFIFNPFGPQEIRIEDSDTLKCVTCPFCKKTVDAKIIHRDGRVYIRCPQCNAEVEKN